MTKLASGVSQDPLAYSELLPLLGCPDCRCALEAAGARLRCPRCSLELSIDDGILSALPQKTAPPKDVRYEHPEYQRYLKVRGDAREYFCEEGGLKGAIQSSGHRLIEKFLAAHPAAGPVVDVGCGYGHHDYAADPGSLVGVEIDPDALAVTRRRFPAARLIRGDCYRLPFQDGALPRCISIYNLEHLYRLEMALDEIHRVLRKPDGLLVASIPTEGGLFWNSGRAVTSARHFKRVYGLDYSIIIGIEHCNTARRVLREVAQRFEILESSFYPLKIPSIDFNFTVTFVARPR